LGTANIFTIFLCWEREGPWPNAGLISHVISLLSGVVVQQSENTASAGTEAPVILAIWEGEIERIMVQGQPRQIIHKTPSPK
jgi:hypothetical protein